MNWKNTTEELPEKGVAFIGYSEKDPIMDIFIDYMVDVGPFGIPVWAGSTHISHWMPMPDYPSESK